MAVKLTSCLPLVRGLSVETHEDRLEFDRCSDPGGPMDELLWFLGHGVMREVPQTGGGLGG